jgi:hypothetical protein
VPTLDISDNIAPCIRAEPLARDDGRAAHDVADGISGDAAVSGEADARPAPPRPTFLAYISGPDHSAAAREGSADERAPGQTNSRPEEARPLTTETG